MIVIVLEAVATAQTGEPVNWPLNQAVLANDVARVKSLLAGQPSQDELDFALVAAAGTGRPEAARLLLTAGASPNRRIAPVEHSAVVVAVREHQDGVLRVLLQHGGDPNGADGIGWRPLHHAVEPNHEHVGAIRVLVEHGADVDGRDGLQRTALHRAAGFGHSEAVRALLALRADPSLGDEYGRTALELAERSGHSEVAALIRSAARAADRPPREIVLSVAINWLFGLFPALLLRFIVLRRPVGKKTAVVVTIAVAVSLTLAASGLAHVARLKPNMAPVAIWTLLTYAILRAGGRQSNKLDT